MKHAQFVTAALAAAALCTVSSTLRAQQPDVYVMVTGQPRFGIMIDMKPDSSRDKIGAEVQEVQPGSPADKSGLKAGDIITKFNGTALGGAKSPDDDQSGPGLKLAELARATDVGDTVKIEYRRGTATMTTTAVAQNLASTGPMKMQMRTMPDPGMWDQMGPMQGMGDMGGPNMMFRGRGGPGFFEYSFGGGGWGALDLVNNNADLGAYFGTSQGVLVTQTPADSTIPLRGGDVILTIGGRTPKSAEHAMQILRSYDNGETIQVEVMRKQKKVALSWTVKQPEMKMRHGTNSGTMKMRQQSLEQS
ncbi:MAG: PDZ domain-containing protein [Gemmatimonadales bacterium]